MEERIRLGHVEVGISAEGVMLNLEFPAHDRVLLRRPKEAQDEGLLSPEEFALLEAVRSALEEAVCPLLSKPPEWHQARRRESEAMTRNTRERKVVYYGSEEDSKALRQERGEE